MRASIRLQFLWLIVIALGCFVFCDRNKSSVQSTSPYPAAKTQNMDGELLNELVTEIENGRYGEVHSLLILRNDSLVLEKYFNRYTREHFHPLYSVTKSFMSALIGISIHLGDIKSVNVNVLSYFPEYKDIANMDSLKRAITLEHLLTMTAGFEWDEFTYPYTDPRNDVVKFYSSDDWIKYVLDLPMSDIPGTRVVYNSGVSMLLSAILTKASEFSASDFASMFLFNPIGITDWTWSSRPNGMSIGGWGLHLRSVDMVRFGQLYLHEGDWQGKQVIPNEWVRASAQSHGRMNEWSDYGYQWWRYSNRMVTAGLMKTNDIYFAAGRGGQFIWVIPPYNMVVVSSAWNDNNGENSEPLLWEYILPAVKD